MLAPFVRLNEMFQDVFTIAGGMDNGESTLIGRLWYDTKFIFEDQLDDIESVSRNLGEKRVNLALLTDDLRTEREQKIIY